MLNGVALFLQRHGERLSPDDRKRLSERLASAEPEDWIRAGRQHYKSARPQISMAEGMYLAIKASWNYRLRSRAL